MNNGGGRYSERERDGQRERKPQSNGWEKNREEEEEKQLKTDYWCRLLGTSSLKERAVWHVRLRRDVTW
jgi:hypothetical protein